MVDHDTLTDAEPDEVHVEVLAKRPGRAFNQMGPFAVTPVWILDPDLYMPGVPDPAALKPGDEKPLTGAEIRTFVALKSYANAEGYCRPNVSTIAARAKVDKSAAERAISKFKRLGWLTADRKYREKDGKRWIKGCDYWIVDVCPAPLSVTVPDDPPASSRVPHPRDGGSPTRTPAGAKNSLAEPTTGTDLGTDQISTTSSRSAPSGGGDTQNEKDPWSARDLNQLREDDFETFKSLAGEQIKSTGRHFTQGTWTAKQIYVGMMKWKIKKKPVTWPGQLLQKIEDDGFGGAEQVEYFLATYGLERVE